MLSNADHAAPTTGNAAVPARAPLPRRPSGHAVAVLSVCAFVAILVLLSVRMLLGEDPALGAGPDPPRPAAERRVDVPPAVDDPPEPAPTLPGDTITGSPTTPVIPSPAPTVAPPAPAPAPSPAPIITGSS